MSLGFRRAKQIVSLVPYVPVLNALGGTFSLPESASAGGIAGTLTGVTSGSTLSLVADGGGRVALSGNSIVRGATALDYETATSHSFTVRETLAGATNTPRDTVLTLNVTNVLEVTLSALTGTFTLAEDAAAGAVAGALSGVSSGSTLSLSNDAGGRVTLSGANIVRGVTPLDYETATSHSFTVVETHPDGANSPRSTTLTLNVTDVVEGASVPSTIDSSLTAPILVLVAGQTSYPPTFNVLLDDTASVSDTIVLRQANDNGFTSGVVDYFNAVDVTEATDTSAGTNGKVTMAGLSTVLSGTHRFESAVIRGSVRSNWSNVITHGPDDQAPTLSAFSNTPAATTAAIGCTTDENNGTLYCVVTATNSAPSKAQVKAGQNSAGGAAVASGNQAISTVGAKSLSVTGLTGGTTYYAWFMHEDAAANQSTVLSGSFTTIVGSVAALYNGAAGTNSSQYITTSGTPKLTWACTADVGAACLVRSTDVPPSKGHFEAKIGTIVAGSKHLVGVSDSSLALGPAVVTYPGQTGAGCTLRIVQGSTSWVLFANGTNQAVTAPNAPAANDFIVTEFDDVAHTVSFWFVRGGTPTLLATVTLTSNIPTNWRATVGADAANGDGGLMNFGAAAWAKAPTAGYAGW